MEVKPHFLGVTQFRIQKVFSRGQTRLIPTLFPDFVDVMGNLRNYKVDGIDEMM